MNNRRISSQWSPAIVIAISAMVISVCVSAHEATHALVCALLNCEVKTFSALGVFLVSADDFEFRLIAGSASLVNLTIGVVFLFLLQHQDLSAHTKYFAWLSMLVNWLYGTGYWLFSGISNYGDWAHVIAGFEPAVLWRSAMVLLGTITFMLSIYSSLVVLGKLVAGSDEVEQLKRFNIVAYFGSLIVIVLAGLVHPDGLFGEPSLAGISAVAGALSPLLWMGYWFESASFQKGEGVLMGIQWHTGWFTIAAVVTFTFIVLLGPGIPRTS